MGRDATDATQPGSVRRTERARLAKETIHKTIPALLHSDARARRGIEAAHLLVDLPRVAPGSTATTTTTTTTPATTNPADTPKKKHPKGKRRGATTHPTPTPTPTPTSRPSDHPPPPPLRIRILPTDTLTAAAALLATNTRPAVLSMASPLRPGGGVFTGAQGQEESLCLRTTLYWSLRESYYRLPALGCVYTPDALVFRRGDGMQVLAKRERFYVDVVSCAALRFPSTEKKEGEGEERYECAADREAMVGKMRVVMRAAARGGVGGVVLGAWGCGAYGNPVGEVAEAWRRVLVGAGGRGGRGEREREVWAGVGEVVFAIDGGTAEGRRQLEVFRRVFEGVACEEEKKQGEEEGGKGKGKGKGEGGGEAVRDEDDPEEVRIRDVQELTEEIKTKEAQLGRIKNESLRERIADLVTSLKKELAIKSGPQAHSDGENDGGGDDDEHGPDQVEEEEEEEEVEEEAEGSASRKA